MKTTVVIPTYNEVKNLPTLVEKIFSLRIPGLSVLVVDDNSPDGTGTAADNLGRKFAVKVIHRKSKSGLGTAYINAFKLLLALPENDRPEYIFEIDADLSHNPEAIPHLLDIIQNADLVLGSRYVKNGKIENWSWVRRLISKFGNIYARNVLRLPYHDLTGGFKCYRRKVLEKINLDSLSSVGYNFQIETTLLAHQAGFKIVETPITFSERKKGASKFNLPIIIESFWKVFLLAFKKT